MPFWRVGIHVFHIFLAILVMENYRFYVFFAKKYDGAKLAPSRGWRFRDAILTRRREQQIPPCLGSFLIFDEKNVFLGTTKIRNSDNNSHTRCQKGGVPEESENRRTSSRFYFLHAFQAPSMSDSLRHAVSAAGPLCTHGKDKPGLGGP